MNLKLGCDPELFLVDATGAFRASCGLIGGTKEAPMPLLELGEGYAVQEDNVAIEFNIPPASNAKEFRESIMKTLDYLASGVNSNYGFTLGKMASASFPSSELTSRAAQEFGCDPDFNAWTGKKNPKPKAADANLRSCGGHIHVGGDSVPKDKQKLIRMMDFFIGVPLTLMDPDKERMELYGKRGAYRDKVYGVEYRTPSNFWVVNNLAEYVFRNTERAVAAVDAQFPVEDYDDSILDAIDNNNKAAAEHLVKTFNLEVAYV